MSIGPMKPLRRKDSSSSPVSRKDSSESVVMIYPSVRMVDGTRCSGGHRSREVASLGHGRLEEGLNRHPHAVVLLQLLVDTSGGQGVAADVQEIVGEFDGRVLKGFADPFQNPATNLRLNS